MLRQVLPDREEVRAAKAWDRAFHALNDGAGEVDEFALQPVIDCGVVACGFVLDRAHKVLGKPYGRCAA